MNPFELYFSPNEKCIWVQTTYTNVSLDLEDATALRDELNEAIGKLELVTIYQNLANQKGDNG